MRSDQSTALGLTTSALEVGEAAETLRSSADPDSRQFASVLLGQTRNQARPFIVLFAPASDGIPVLPMLASVAVAIREIQNLRVAILALAGSPAAEQDGARDRGATERFPGWIVGESGGIASVRRLESSDTARGIVGAVELATLLSRLQAEYDVLLLDAGATASGAQSLIAAPQCSGVVVLAGSGGTTARELAAARSALAQVNAKILGCALARGV